MSFLRNSCEDNQHLPGTVDARRDFTLRDGWVQPERQRQQKMTTEVTEKSHRGTEEAKANAMMGVPPLGFLVFPLCISRV